MEKIKSRSEVNNDLAALCVVLRSLGIDAPYSEIGKLLKDPREVSHSDINYLCREQWDLSVKKVSLKNKGFEKFAKPLLLRNKNGELEVLVSLTKDGAGIFDIATKGVKKKSYEELYRDFDFVYLFKKNFKGGEEEEDFFKEFTLFSIFQSLFRDRKILMSVILAALCIHFFALASPLFTMIIIDKVFSSSGRSTLYALIVGLVFINFFEYILSLGRKSLLFFSSHRIDVLLLSRVFRKLSHLPMSFFHKRRTGDVVSRIRDVEKIRGFITGPTLNLFIDLPFTVIFIALMFFFSKLLTVIVLGAVVLLFLIFFILSPFMQSRVQKKHSEEIDTQSFLYEMVGSMESLKSTSTERQMQKRWEDQILKYSHHSMDTEKMQGGIFQLAGLVSKLTITVSLWLGAIEVLDGNMTAGQLIAFNMMVGRVIAPVQRIMQILQQLSQINLSLKKVREIFVTPPEPFFSESKKDLPSIKGEVEFLDVSFRYNEEAPFVLKNVSFKVEAGEVVGIIGPSGSGKTTLTKLLLRLYLPDSGKILIDKMDTAHIDPTSLRNHFGVVEQDNVLFHLTVRENISLSDPTADMKRVEKVASLVGADEFIRNLPNGYDTVVGERGNFISVGQRQRIAIARALLKNPKILILDESTTFLDYESEVILEKNMQNICKGRTVFIVSHRPSSLWLANKIISIDHCTIEEIGTPRDLIRTSSRFAKLCAFQKSHVLQDRYRPTRKKEKVN